MRLRDENGVALVVSMMFLLVLSLLVAVLHHDALTEIISSRDFQLSRQSFYAAESGLRDAHNWLSGQASAPENAGTTPPWFYNSSTAMPSAAGGWSGYVTSGGGRYRYYVEHLKDAVPASAAGESAKVGTNTATGGMLHYYRITSEGSTTNNSIRKIVQIVTTARY